MELLQLRYFFDSAKYESFAKAAQKHMVPTPSVAASVKRLEKELNCRLFDRYANRISLNNNGKKLLHSLSSVFSEIDGIPSLLTDEYADNREIKILIRAMSRETASLINQHRKLYPYINFKISFSHPNCDYHDYHIIIDEKTDLYPDYVKYDSASTELLFVANRHPFIGKKLTVKDLYHEPFITNAEDSATYRGLITACKRLGFSPHIVATYGDTLSYQDAIREGVGIGIVRKQAYYAVSSPFFQILNTPDDLRISQVVSVYYNQQTFYGNVKHFFDFISKKDFIDDCTRIMLS